MKTRLHIYALVFACCAAPLWADARKDADYIVSQTVTRTLFEGALSAQKPLITGAMQNDLRQRGITLNDPDRLYDLLMEEWIGEFVKAMQSQSAAIYLDNFSPEQLSDLAAFFASNSGQAYLKATPTLMQRAVDMGQNAGRIAGTNAGRRLAERIEAENLISIEDPSVLKKVIDALK